MNAAVYGPGATRANTNQRRPRLEYTSITRAGTYGKSNYNALVLSLERRLASGLTFLAGYSWQKSFDVGSSSAFEGNISTHGADLIELDYGLSDFSRTGRFVGSFNYVLPTPTGGLRHVLGGWQTNGIITFQTGATLSETRIFRRTARNLKRFSSGSTQMRLQSIRRAPLARLDETR